jgi:hypothetical protein
MRRGRSRSLCSPDDVPRPRFRALRSRTNLALAIGCRTALVVAPEDPREIIPIGKTAAGGDLIDAAIGQGEELGRVPGTGLLDIDRRCGAGVFLEPSDEGALTHGSPPREDGISQLACQLVVNETEDLGQTLGLLRRDGDLQAGKAAMEQGGAEMVEVLPGD